MVIVNQAYFTCFRSNIVHVTFINMTLSHHTANTDFSPLVLTYNTFLLTIHTMVLATTVPYFETGSISIIQITTCGAYSQYISSIFSVGCMPLSINIFFFLSSSACFCICSSLCISSISSIGTSSNGKLLSISKSYNINVSVMVDKFSHFPASFTINRLRFSSSKVFLTIAVNKNKCI